PPNKAQEKFTDLDGADLLEIRSTGGQTLAPPGAHEAGESIVWYTHTHPSTVGFDELQGAARALAAVSLLARYWPRKGTRQDAFLALAGGLLLHGWDEARAERFLAAVCAATGDEETSKRRACVAQTARKIGGDNDVTGWRRLSELLGDRGQEVVTR